MVRILLLHTNESYAETLAHYVSAEYPSYDVDVVSRVPVPERLRALLAREYDLIQTDELIANGMLATGASAVFDVPLVVTIRGWADYTNAHGQYGWLKNTTIQTRTRLALHQASEVIFISGTTSEMFRKQYPVSQYSVIGRPVDTDRYGAGQTSDRETFDLLTVTNLRYEEKYDGVLTVLCALRPLFKEHPALRYRVAGGGQYLTALREYLSDYEYADCVTALGFVDAVEDEFASADAFVYVSFLDAYPTVVLEAQAAGLPVIGGDAVGVPDVVGEAGDISPPTSDGVRETIEHLLTDDDHRESLASQSRRKMTTYNEERAADHVDVWERVLDT
ncbi:glycosyltransferase family 4 protein [Halorubrum ezzemoulense]|uniref:glycosyltransferase family 4 protein n=1 Tax=Halorubrum ezzemoulense TaxID=337243 RepID=UPI00232EB9CC|nr:glycosyltransferase family 4 protein [Halorubrum ezzemoulense]MDB9278564.1 glycosyltransferase family 4 protein [Halorubrum ezzemoulense]MDB9282236.1 glycosyltransferase family 4 protein [Halorubrum ezzemoulense]